jgi:phage terminase small subunit
VATKKKAAKKIPAKNADVLTEKEILFCDHFLICFNGTKAAIKAGYSKKAAAQQASRLLTKVKVQNYLQAKKEKVLNKLEISQERTMQEIARLAFQDIRKFYKEDGSLIPIHELDDDAAAVLAGMEIEEVKHRGRVVATLRKIKRWDKCKGLEMLAKIQGLYSDGGNTGDLTVIIE